ncbi:MAG: HAD-IIIA family hydrolase [Planctomycetes bacterium]|nr:HAD-IIIA family hydrolase [Planctomycetota bacterium]
MKTYDGYLFDADGTLFDSRELIIQAYYVVAEWMRLPPPDREKIAATTGLTMPDQVRLLFGRDRDDMFYRNVEALYSSLVMAGGESRLSLFPGVKDGLRRLREHGVRLAVVTSRRRQSLEYFLGSLGVLELFDVIVTAEDTVKHKPGPEPVLLALEQLSMKPEQCVYVGDAVFDVECGSAAGVDTVLVSWGGMDPSGWTVQPGRVIDRFDELLDGQ